MSIYKKFEVFDKIHCCRQITDAMLDQNCPRLSSICAWAWVIQSFYQSASTLESIVKIAPTLSITLASSIYVKLFIKRLDSLGAPLLKVTLDYQAAGSKAWRKRLTQAQACPRLSSKPSIILIKNQSRACAFKGRFIVLCRAMASTAEAAALAVTQASHTMHTV